MELRQLKYFVTFAEYLNFTRAAQALHIAQPALSAQIRNLETEIGATLVLREGRNTRLTEVGRILYEQARKTVLNAQRCITLAQQAAHGNIGHLSIGYSAPAGFLVFPRLVPAFERARPNIHLNYRALSSSAQQVDGVLRDELDLGVVWLPVAKDAKDDLDIQGLITVPLVAAIPVHHRLARASRVSIGDLSREPLILPKRSQHPHACYQIEQEFVRTDSTLNVVHELENSLTMINFVAMGAGCSLLPDYVRSIRQRGVVYKRLAAPRLDQTLAMIKKKDRVDLPELFFQFAREYFSGRAKSRESRPVAGANVPRGNGAPG
jgi:DNA-binding transcriptional LysR family regulator